MRSDMQIANTGSRVLFFVCLLVSQQNPSKEFFRQSQAMKAFRVWNRCVLNMFIVTDSTLVTLHHHISSGITDDIRQREVAACILKRGGNFCRQFLTLAVIVLFTCSQWETSLRTDVHILLKQANGWDAELIRQNVRLIRKEATSQKMIFKLSAILYRNGKGAVCLYSSCQFHRVGLSPTVICLYKINSSLQLKYIVCIRSDFE